MKAFVSCSLREEDRDFIEQVCGILKEHDLIPFGTVGMFSASPENPVTLMNKNLPESDIVVVCATPRYLTKDIQTGKKSNGLSEMIHVETGMAIASKKPVVVFVQEGTNVGNAIPSITQYITLSTDKEKNKGMITSLLFNAKQLVKELDGKKSINLLGKATVVVFAIYGGYHLIRAIFRKSK